MKNVLTTRVYSPQNFVELLTGNCYFFDEDDDFQAIHYLLEQNGLEDEENPLWDYPLDEIDEIVENGARVILVEGMVTNENGKLINVLRWVEVPVDFEMPIEERD